MTVSSSQPQDGSVSASQRTDANRIDASHSSETLPPTLFVLPNLRAEVAHGPAFASAPAKEKSISPQILRPLDSSPVASPATATAFTSTPLVAAESTASKIIRHDQPVANRVPEDHQSLHRQREIADPASYAQGKDQATLLDRIGSHAIVLAMLLVVFGIALLAGRKPIVESTTPVATQQDNSESPQVALTSAVPEAMSPESAISAVVDTSVPVMAGPVNGATNGPINEAATEQATEQLNNTISAVPSIESTTFGSNGLQPSAPTQPSTGISASAISAKSTNVSNSDSSSGDVQSAQTSEAASPREPSSEAYTSVGSVRFNELIAEGPATSNGYRNSKTPQSINDWSRYLKPLDSSYITPSSAVTTQP